MTRNFSFTSVTISSSVFPLVNFARAVLRTELHADERSYHGSFAIARCRFIYFGNNCTGHYGVINCCGVNVLPITGKGAEGVGFDAVVGRRFAARA